MVAVKRRCLRIVAGLEWPNAGGTVTRLGSQLQDLRALHRSIGWVSHELARRIPARERVIKLVASGRVAELGLRPPIATEASDDELRFRANFWATCNSTHLPNADSSPYLKANSRKCCWLVH